MRSAFWDDHQRDMESPEYAREFAAESIRTRTIDEVMNTLDHALEESGLSKAALARAIGSDPAVVRRIFNAESVNPTLGTLSEIAAALGLKITLEPMGRSERDAITKPMVAAAKAPLVKKVTIAA
ncbi:helix-turn-helix transcriptional regulator [Sanguibacter sp. 25GB23B1]|uniref:helix-turn-helix domain-containing protein n=1 Tax=unclassified Sanguibacter TaxID=2645534 RepID=UPI0032AF8803